LICATETRSEDQLNIGNNKSRNLDLLPGIASIFSISKNINPNTVSSIDPNNFYFNFEPDRAATGSYQFNGFHSVAYRYARRYYNAAVNDFFRDLWSGGSLSGLDFQKRLESFRFAEANPSAHWWQRDWRDSLVPEKGGWPRDSRVVSFGEETSLVDLAGVQLTNEGKIRLGDLLFYLENRRQAPSPGAVSLDDLTERALERLGRENFGFSVKRGNLFSSQHFTGNLRIAVRFKIPSSEDPQPMALQVISSASFQFDLGVYASRNKQVRQLGVLTLRGEYSAPRNFSGSIYFVSFNW
jgi:hypothetical protein